MENLNMIMDLAGDVEQLGGPLGVVDGGVVHPDGRILNNFDKDDVEILSGVLRDDLVARGLGVTFRVYSDSSSMVIWHSESSNYSGSGGAWHNQLIAHLKTWLAAYRTLQFNRPER